MENAVMIFFGLVLIFLGISNTKGDIRSIHSCNRIRITEETRKKYGRLMGIGTIIIGSGLIFAGILSRFPKSNSLEFFKTLIIVLTVIAGIAIMLYAQIKYNKGIF